jgi:hypothetical protein
MNIMMVVLPDHFYVCKSRGLVIFLFLFMLVCVLFFMQCLLYFYRWCIFSYDMIWCSVTEIILYYCCMHEFVVKLVSSDVLIGFV